VLRLGRPTSDACGHGRAPASRERAGELTFSSCISAVGPEPGRGHLPRRASGHGIDERDAFLKCAPPAGSRLTVMERDKLVLSAILHEQEKMENLRDYERGSHSEPLHAYTCAYLKNW